MAAVCGGSFQAVACTGIALTAADGSYVQSRTIEWARGVLQSEYVVIPRGQRLRSFTPLGADGMTFTAKYGVVGLSVVQKEFIAEGINEAGLSAGLFFFPQYGGYEPYDGNRYGYLHGFSVAGADRRFVWAKAYIRDDKAVVVFSDEVAEPVAVRYGWADNPQDDDLTDASGLLASPFRTDDWPGITK